MELLTSERGVVDLNHPLAGKELEFEVGLQEVAWNGVCHLPLSN